jgi:hypothetical protein
MTFLRAQWSRLTAGIALACVAAGTGVISYRHIYELTIALGQPPLVARLQPVGIDGLIVVGSVVLLQATPNHPYLGWFGVVPGVLASVFANVESGLGHGWLGAIWAGVPAGGFALATFLLERWLKDQVGRVVTGGTGPVGNGEESTPNPASANQCPHGVARTVEEAVTLAFLHKRDCLEEKPSIRQLSATWNISRPRTSQLVGALNGSMPADMNGDDSE